MPQRQAGLLFGRGHRGTNSVGREFFSFEVAIPPRFLQKLEHGGLAVPTPATDDVANVVAVQAAEGREDQLVVLAFLKFMRFEHHGLGRLGLPDRDELIKVGIDGQGAKRNSVGEGEGVPALG